MKDVLISRDTKGKVRVLNFNLEHIKADSGDSYIIHRSSGLLNGKMIEQPDLAILKGKVKRTVQEQSDVGLLLNRL